VFYGALALRGLGRLYVIPAGVAVVSGWTAAAAMLEIAPEWGGAWYMTLAAVLSAAAPRRKAIVICAAALAALSLAWSYAATAGDHHWQLAATHAIATAATAWTAYRRRSWAGVFVLLPLGAATVSAALWPLGAPAPVVAYPFLVSGGLALAIEALVGRFPTRLEGGLWWYATATSLAPLFALRTEEDPALSGIGCFGSSALLAYAAWKNTRWGLTGSLVPEGEARRTQWGERAVFAWAAAGFALGGAALLQEQVGVSSPERGWLFAVLAAVPALVIGGFPRAGTVPGLAVALPVSVAAAIVSLPVEGHDPLYGAVFLAVPGVAWLAASVLSGRWTAAVAGVAFLSVASGYLRSEWDWPAWALALGFGGAGLVLFLGLSAFRDYQSATERAISAIVLSWGLVAIALLIAAGAILDFQGGRTEVGRELFGLVVDRGEYRALIVLVLGFAAMLLFEAYRVQSGAWLLAASAAAMVGVLLAIGLANPKNVQFYTAPVGVYLLALGLAVRRSPAFSPHLQIHEAALVAGVAFIVLPQAEQSFDPGGAWWGLVLIGEGLLFLAGGLLLGARWLVPSGILILSGVGIRWLFESGQTVPYWLTLGLLGTLLLAGGLLVLLHADWWANTRAHASRWWQQGSSGA
jgi:hypothetical protein